MPHQRDEIKRHALEVLSTKTSLAKAYGLVESSFRDDLPAKITVFSPRETVFLKSAAPRVYQRTLTMDVTLSLRGEANYARADQLAAEVERAMLGPEFEAGFYRKCELRSTEQVVDYEGKVLVASVNLSFEVTYLTEEDHVVPDEYLTAVDTELNPIK